MGEVKKYFWTSQRLDLEFFKQASRFDPIMILSIAAIFLRREIINGENKSEYFEKRIIEMVDLIYELIYILGKNKELREGGEQLDIYGTGKYKGRSIDYPYLIKEDEGWYAGNCGRAKDLLLIAGNIIIWDIISLSDIRMEYEKLMHDLSNYASEEFNIINKLKNPNDDWEFE